jgi:hypothetical protein
LWHVRFRTGKRSSISAALRSRVAG